MTETSVDFSPKMIEALIDIAREAGKLTLSYFQTDFDIYTKDNQSPVTLADQQAERLVLAALRDLTPHIPCVGEEEAAAGLAPSHESLSDFWLVDPLDGTKEFIKGRPEYTVNIGFVKNKRAHFGLIYVPVLDECFYGLVGAGSAFYSGKGERIAKPIRTRPVPDAGMTVVSSINHNDPEKMKSYLAEYTHHSVHNVVRYGSALKFCRLAQGLADFYPRFAPTSEWDTAAGHAIVEAAGGILTHYDGTPFTYAKRADFLNPLFIAKGFAD